MDSMEWKSFTGHPLTVALILGRSLPKGSSMAIKAEMNMIAQKELKRLPLKFQVETFNAILGRRFTGNGS